MFCDNPKEKDQSDGESSPVDYDQNEQRDATKNRLLASHKENDSQSSWSSEDGNGKPSSQPDSVSSPDESQETRQRIRNEKEKFTRDYDTSDEESDYDTSDEERSVKSNRKSGEESDAQSNSEGADSVTNSSNNDDDTQSPKGDHRDGSSNQLENREETDRSMDNGGSVDEESSEGSVAERQSNDEGSHGNGVAEDDSNDICTQEDNHEEETDESRSEGEESDESGARNDFSVAEGGGNNDDSSTQEDNSEEEADESMDSESREDEESSENSDPDDDLPDDYSDLPQFYPPPLQAIAQDADIVTPLFSAVAPPFFPKWTMRTDVDSIYSTHHSLSDVVKAYGGKVEYILPVTTSRLTSSKGSRYCFDLRRSPHQVLLRNSVADTCSGHLFPDVKICKILFPELLCEAHVQLSFLGCERITSSGMFTEIQMAVVNACLNIARQICIEDHGNDQATRSCFNEMYPFETAVGSREWSNWAHSTYVNQMSSVNMTLFAAAFHNALDMIARNDETYAFWLPVYTGLKYEDLRNGTEREEMSSFAQDLRPSLVFQVSCAGIKKFFEKEEFELEVRTPEDLLDTYNDMLENSIEVITHDYQRYILDHYDVEDESELDEDALVHWRTLERPPNLEEIGATPVFWDHFPTFGDDFGSYIGEQANSLVQNAYDILRKALDRDSDDNHEDSLIHFDIGVQVWFPNDNSILVSAEPAKAMLEYLLSLL